MPDQACGNRRRSEHRQHRDTVGGALQDQRNPEQLGLKNAGHHPGQQLAGNAAQRQRDENQQPDFAEQDVRDLLPREAEYAQGRQVAAAFRQRNARAVVHDTETQRHRECGEETDEDHQAFRHGLIEGVDRGLA